MNKVRVRLDTPTGLIELPPGQYVVGRSPDCDVVIASGRASRQHARVVVDDGGATIEDLGTSNGTYINGGPIRGKRALADADFVVIGDVALEVAMTPVSERVAGSPASRASSPEMHYDAELGAASHRQSVSDAEPPIPAQHATPTRNLSTVPAQAHEVLAATAAHFFEQDQVLLAEKILEGWLLQMLTAARTGAPRDEEGDGAALEQGARLAKALTSARWLGYCLELAAELRRPLSKSELDVLETVVLEVGVPRKLLERYLVMLRNLPEEDGGRTGLARAEGWQSHAT
jgi:hypothetical protein